MQKRGRGDTDRKSEICRERVVEMREKYKESVRDREREGMRERERSRKGKEREGKVVISMSGLHLLHCQGNFFDNPVH